MTSVSMDPHKFGLSGKGASILLYSSAKLRRGQFFTTCMWPGGLYGTAGIAGSRSGVAIASAWISMMKMGINGYKESAERVQSGKNQLIQLSVSSRVLWRNWASRFMEMPISAQSHFPIPNTHPLICSPWSSKKSGASRCSKSQLSCTSPSLL